MTASPDPPSVQLIEAGLEHAALVDRLVAAFHRHEGVSVAANARRASIEGLLGAPAQGRILLVKSYNAGIVGYAVLAFGYSLEFGGRDAFLDELFIAEDVRGRGIGSATLAAVCAWARRENLCALHLEVERDNETAKALYIRAGFEDRSRYHLMSLHIANVQAD